MLHPDDIPSQLAWSLLQGGDHRAFASLVCLHEARLRGAVARLVADADDVQDIVQDCYVQAYVHRAQLLPGLPIYPWLRGIARHLAMNHLRSSARRHGRHQAAARLLAQAQAETAQDNDDSRIEALRLCLADLDAADRDLLQARYRDDVPVQDLARARGQRPNAVSMRLLRLRELLRHCVERRLLEVNSSQPAPDTATRSPV